MELTEEDLSYLRFINIVDKALDFAGSDEVLTPEDYKFAKDCIIFSRKQEKERRNGQEQA